MRKLHNERSSEQNVFVTSMSHAQHQFIETYLKTKKAKFVWSVGTGQRLHSVGVRREGEERRRHLPERRYQEDPRFVVQDELREGSRQEHLPDGNRASRASGGDWTRVVSFVHLWFHVSWHPILSPCALCRPHSSFSRNTVKDISPSGCSRTPPDWLAITPVVCCR